MDDENEFEFGTPLAGQDGQARAGAAGWQLPDRGVAWGRGPPTPDQTGPPPPSPSATRTPPHPVPDTAARTGMKSTARQRRNPADGKDLVAGILDHLQEGSGRGAPLRVDLHGLGDASSRLEALMVMAALADPAAGRSTKELQATMTAQSQYALSEGPPGPVLKQLVGVPVSTSFNVVTMAVFIVRRQLQDSTIPWAADDANCVRMVIAVLALAKAAMQKQPVSADAALRVADLTMGAAEMNHHTKVLCSTYIRMLAAGRLVDSFTHTVYTLGGCTSWEEVLAFAGGFTSVGAMRTTLESSLVPGMGLRALRRLFFAEDPAMARDRSVGIKTWSSWVAPMLPLRNATDTTSAGLQRRLVGLVVASNVLFGRAATEAYLGRPLEAGGAMHPADRMMLALYVDVIDALLEVVHPKSLPTGDADARGSVVSSSTSSFSLTGDNEKEQHVAWTGAPATGTGIAPFVAEEVSDRVRTAMAGSRWCLALGNVALAIAFCRTQVVATTKLMDSLGTASEQLKGDLARVAALVTDVCRFKTKLGDETDAVANAVLACIGNEAMTVEGVTTVLTSATGAPVALSKTVSEDQQWLDGQLRDGKPIGDSVLGTVENMWINGTVFSLGHDGFVPATHVAVVFKVHDQDVPGGPHVVPMQNAVAAGDSVDFGGRLVAVDAKRADRMTLDVTAAVGDPFNRERPAALFVLGAILTSPTTSVTSASGSPLALPVAGLRANPAARMTFSQTSPMVGAGSAARPLPPPPVTPPRSAAAAMLRSPVGNAPVVADVTPGPESFDMDGFGGEFVPQDATADLRSPGEVHARVAPAATGWMTTEDAADALRPFDRATARELLRGRDEDDDAARYSVLAHAWLSFMRPFIGDVRKSGWTTPAPDVVEAVEMDMMGTRSGWLAKFFSDTVYAYAAMENADTDIVPAMPDAPLPLYAPLPPGLFFSAMAVARCPDDGFLDASFVTQPFNLPVPVGLTAGVGFGTRPPTAFTSPDWLGQSMMRGTAGADNSHALYLQAAATAGWLGCTQPVDAMTLTDVDAEPLFVTGTDVMKARGTRGVVNPEARRRRSPKVVLDPRLGDTHRRPVGSGVCHVTNDDDGGEWDATALQNDVTTMDTEAAGSLAVWVNPEPAATPLVTVYPVGHPFFVGDGDVELQRARETMQGLELSGAITAWTPGTTYMLPAVFGDHATSPAPGTPYPDDGSLQCTATLAMNAMRCDGAAVMNDMSHGSLFLTAAVRALVDEFNRPAGAGRSVADANACILGLRANGMSIRRKGYGLARLLEVLQAMPPTDEDDTVVVGGVDSVSASRVEAAWKEEFDGDDTDVEAAVVRMRAERSPFNSPALHRMYSMDAMAGVADLDTGRAVHPFADWTTCVRAVQSSFDPAASFLRYAAEPPHHTVEASAMELTQAASTLNDAVAMNSLLWKRFLCKTLAQDMRDAAASTPGALRLDPLSASNLQHGAVETGAGAPGAPPSFPSGEAAPRWNMTDKWATLAAVQAPAMAILARALCRALTRNTVSDEQVVPPSQRSGIASGTWAGALCALLDGKQRAERRGPTLSVAGAARQIERGFIDDNAVVSDVHVSVDGATEYLCGVSIATKNDAASGCWRYQYSPAVVRTEWVAVNNTAETRGISLPDDFVRTGVFGTAPNTLRDDGRQAWVHKLMADNADGSRDATLASLRHILVVNVSLSIAAAPRLRVVVPMFLGREAAMGAMIPYGVDVASLLTWDCVHVAATTLSPDLFAGDAEASVAASRRLAFDHTSSWTAVPVNPATDAVHDMWRYPEDLAAMYGAVYAGMGTQLASSTMGYVSGYDSPLLRQFGPADDRGAFDPSAHRAADDIDRPHHADPGYTPARPSATPVVKDPATGRPAAEQYPRLAFERVNGTGLGVYRGWVAAAVTQAAHGAKTRFDMMGVMADDNMPRPADLGWKGDVADMPWAHRHKWASQVLNQPDTGTETAARDAATFPDAPNMAVTGRYNIGIGAIGAPLFWALGGTVATCRLQALEVTPGSALREAVVRVASGIDPTPGDLQTVWLQARASYAAAVTLLATRKDPAMPLVIPRGLLDKLQPAPSAAAINAVVDSDGTVAKWTDKPRARADMTLAPPTPSLRHANPDGTVKVGTPWNGLTRSNTGILSHTLAFDMGNGASLLANNAEQLRRLQAQLETEVPVVSVDGMTFNVHPASEGLPSNARITPEYLASAMRHEGRALVLLNTVTIPAMKRLARDMTGKPTDDVAAATKRPLDLFALRKEGSGALSGASLIRAALEVMEATTKDTSGSHFSAQAYRKAFRKVHGRDPAVSTRKEYVAYMQQGRPPSDARSAPGVMTPSRETPGLDAAQMRTLDAISTVAPATSGRRMLTGPSLVRSTARGRGGRGARRAIFTPARSPPSPPSRSPPPPPSDKVAPSTPDRAVALGTPEDAVPSDDDEEVGVRFAPSPVRAASVVGHATPAAHRRGTPQASERRRIVSDRGLAHPGGHAWRGKGHLQEIPAGVPVLAMTFATAGDEHITPRQFRSYLLRWVPGANAGDIYPLVDQTRYAIPVATSHNGSLVPNAFLRCLLTGRHGVLVQYRARWAPLNHNIYGNFPTPVAAFSDTCGSLGSVVNNPAVSRYWKAHPDVALTLTLSFADAAGNVFRKGGKERPVMGVTLRLQLADGEFPGFEAERAAIVAGVGDPMTPVVTADEKAAAAEAVAAFAGSVPGGSRLLKKEATFANHALPAAQEETKD